MSLIEFSSKPWTLRDLRMVTRIQANAQDIEALIALLVSRSNASEETILGLEVSELGPLVEQMVATLNTATTLMTLAKSWSPPIKR